MRPRTLAPLLLLGAVPAVSANPLVDLVVGLGDFTRRFAFAGETAFVGLVALALFVLYLILFQMVFKAINKNNEGASPRLVNAGIIIFSAILAIFSSVNLPREALRALVAQYTVLGYILLGVVVPFGLIAFAVHLKHKHQDNPGVSIGAGFLLVFVGWNLTSAIDGLGAAGFPGTLGWIRLIQAIVVIAGAWMALSSILALFGIGGGGAGGGAGGGGGRGGGAGGGGRGGGQRHSRPNQVYGIKLSTEPDAAMDALSADQRRYAINVEWTADPSAVAAERIDNYQISVWPSRLITPGYRSRWARWSGGTVPFMSKQYFSASHAPAVVPNNTSDSNKRFPLNAEFNVSVRSHNTSGWGPWSSPARIVIGANGPVASSGARSSAGPGTYRVSAFINLHPAGVRMIGRNHGVLTHPGGTPAAVASGAQFIFTCTAMGGTEFDPDSDASFIRLVGASGYTESFELYDAAHPKLEEWLHTNGGTFTKAEIMVPVQISMAAPPDRYRFQIQLGTL
jgi:uncharacterized membrane protein YgcG